MIAAVVPMKPLVFAKQRLSCVLSRSDRLKLVRTMLDDVLTTLRACDAIARTFIVTADAEIAENTARYNAEHIAEGNPAGLNEAVAGAARALEAHGIETMLVIPGDVPLATPAGIAKLASLARPQRVVIVPDHEGQGTNALLLSPPAAIAPAFGLGSYERHIQAVRDAGLEPVTCQFEGLAQDIDEPEDLRILAERTVGRDDYAFLRHALTTANLEEPQNA